MVFQICSLISYAVGAIAVLEVNGNAKLSGRREKINRENKRALRLEHLVGVFPET